MLIKNALNVSICTAFLCLLVFPVQAAGKKPATRIDGIAASVGGQAITSADVNDRMRLIMVSSGLPDVPDMIARVRPQVINSLVEEAIKTQEAERLKIKVDAADVDKAIADIAKQNNMAADKFLGMLRKTGVNPQTLRNQIRAQLLWVKVVTRKIRPQINVTEGDIDAEIAQQQTLAGQREFLLAEIVLPFDGIKSVGQVADLAERLAKQARLKPLSFPDLARQFSRAAGAMQGGNAGWFAEKQLPNERAAIFGDVRAGMVMGPIKTPDSYDIVLIRDIRTRDAQATPNREEIATRIGLERLDRQQRRYLMDLKSSSFVDIRAQ